MAELIEMTFVMWTQVRLKKRATSGPDSAREGAILRGEK